MISVICKFDVSRNRSFRCLRPWPKLARIIVTGVEIDDPRIFVFAGCQNVKDFVLFPIAFEAVLTAEKRFDSDL